MEEETIIGESESKPALRLSRDVYLNFRSVDTGETFTRPLHKALVSKGVRTFIDSEEFTEGDELEHKLHDAIEDCAAAIAIISPSYASSKQCLEELAKILECRRLILPVFYHVNPSDVRRQRGPFEKDFEKLERSGVKQVARWRYAMEKTGGRSGWVVEKPRSSDGGDDTDLIQLLVKRILYELSKTPMAVASYIVGHRNSIEELMRLLDVNSNGIRVVGICGMGGIGKTTLAKSLYNKKLVAQFEHRSFISNVRETYEKQPNGLSLLRSKLRGDLSLGDEVRETRVVVVLDDVDDASQLRELAAWWRIWFDEGSRIIITTRNRELLDDCHVAGVYEVKQLHPSDSLELFLYHALRSKKTNERLLKLSHDIVSCTGGLPLAVEVFGSFLFDKRRDVEWEDAVEKLKKIRPGHLQDVLRISFDGLDEEQKCIFLDISCLFVQLDMKLENAIDILKGCGFKAEMSIGVLIARSLMRIEESGSLWMHDQIRDMGRQIVQLENADFGKRSRLWDRGEILNVLHNNKGTKRVQGILVDLEKNISPMERTDEFIAWGKFPGIPCITYAIKYMIETYKKCFHHGTKLEENVILETKLFQSMARLRLLQLGNVRLKGSFKCMPRELKWLQWKHCPLDSFPSDFFPQLTVLDVSDSKIKSLWDEKRCRWWWWFRVKVAENLIVINLHGCCNLTSLPDFSRHPTLEKLILKRCISLDKVHKSLGELSKLRHLNLKDCYNLVEFPSCVSGLKSLETLTFSGCSKLGTLPSDLGGLISLKKLFLDETIIEELPNTITGLTNLEVLSLNYCQSLKQLPHDIGNLVSLRTLSVSSSVLQELPNSICELENLEMLSLLRSQTLSVLPINVGNLKTLSRFWYGGGLVKELPASIGSLSYLKKLFVSNCPNLDELPITIGCLASAIELKLDGLPIKSLPDCFEGLKSLQKLEIRNCKELQSLPESIGCALTLTEIIIENTAITKLPDSIGMLENLSLLRLTMCTQLCELPYSFGKLKSLRHLYMKETEITKLPASFGLLLNLITLVMPKKRYVENTKSTLLPDSFSGLSSLQEFDANSWKIGKIPDNFENLTSLETLNLGHNDFNSLPSSLRGLSVLRKLFLQHCENLKVLSPLPSSLVELNAANCISMETISNVSNLSNLRDLNLANCGKLTHVPGLECLSSLRRLHMSGCTSCSAVAQDKLTKLAVRKLYSLSWPGKKIPDWFTQEEIIFSNPRKLTVTAVIVGFIVSVNYGQMPDYLKGHLRVVLGVKIKIYRSNSWIYQNAPRLEGIPNTGEDHFFLCRYVDHRPLVSLLKDGDKIKVEMVDPPIGWVQLKESGINLVFENDDDYVGDEQCFPEDQRTVSDNLTTFIRESSSASDSISNI